MVDVRQNSMCINLTHWSAGPNLFLYNISQMAKNGGGGVECDITDSVANEIRKTLTGTCEFYLLFQISNTRG